MEATQTETRKSIHPNTEMGLLSLSVSDLSRSLSFYTRDLGFAILAQSDTEATLGADKKPLLLLQHKPGATAWPRGGRSYTGLYHFAILLPSRADLGAWVQHWLGLGRPIGQGDHIVSEALYLEDPDGHGIEIYRDRPRDQWIWENGRVRMGSGPVDIHGMIEEAQIHGKLFSGLPIGTKLGHMHLQVGDIPEAERFYTHILGFDIVASMPTALFISAGGYHHHIGMNTWHSSEGTAAPDESVNLNFFTIDLPSNDAVKEVKERLDAAGVPYREDAGRIIVDDPWGNRAVLTVAE